MTSEALILNVDDYDAARYAKSRILRHAGFKVVEAGNGKDALDMVAKLQPALVLLDVKLPDIDGREVCRRIRANSSSKNTPVVHTSAAFVSDSDKAQGRASGGDDYVAAPFQPNDLITAVRSFLQ
jgi:CheY-like chemotaxis protein